jgi:hypothetical protein
MIGEHATEFAGKAVRDWNAENSTLEPEKYHYRIRMDWNEAEANLWTDRFAAFLDSSNVAQVTGFVVGDWGHSAEGNGSEPVVEALVAARDQLPHLTAIFIGDMTYEDCEISWISQSDMSPLFAAYPRLEHFRVRGGNDLTFGTLRHEHLKSLIIETGGMPLPPLQQVLNAHLPALEHLELWLGTEGYGWDGTLQDLTPLLNGSLFPNLRYLGLRNSEIADEIAGVLATSPILERIRVLDLSLGTLSNAGAEALLASPYLPRLEKLDLHHHYLSEGIMTRLEALPIEVDVSGQEKADEDDRYVAVGE